jgi:CubicO group peptidase (beta-lactamase class C family)
VIASASKMTLNNYLRLKIGRVISMDGFFLEAGYNNVYYSTTLSMARYGLLLLGKGKWGNDQIIPEAYYRLMTTSSQTINPSYGYLTWLNGKNKFTLPSSAISFNGSLIPNAPADLFAALGKNDQKIHVVPSLDLVIVRMGNAAGDEYDNVPITLDKDIWYHLSKAISIQTNTKAVNFEKEHGINAFVYRGQILNIENFDHAAKVLLFNTKGQLVMQVSQAETDLSHLAKGLYIVRARSKKGELSTSKILL